MRIPNYLWCGFDRCYRVVISGFIDIFLRSSDAVISIFTSDRLLYSIRCPLRCYNGAYHFLKAFCGPQSCRASTDH
ncbi:hypothetical protein BDV38DRAFT_265602 [Aspergillus pseudotamarii]|uniref:Uncharacterized protein n=1 Tax=Aspergillus pseudotamarii TaxID=132259 RepID=A0A5N6S8W8_ASPPS|nr:uncharacterized protein BDV38DRAFT_265602 [Aspergillus pseudotamarii]KAE8131005.1 hypothetical protein BDV38DRAFT_265602 [Aspergillus pseudotamarii]